MALQWSDFPSGQRGIYGTDETNMLDGTPWLAYALSGGSASLQSDPDSGAFPNGIVLQHGAGADGPEDAVRLGLTTPHQEVGVEFRFYASQLPSNASGRCFVTFNTTGNAVRYNLVLMPNGSIRLYYSKTSLGPGTLLADTVSPVIFANTWNHIGFKADVVTGEVMVQKNGVEIASLTYTDPSPPGGTIGIVGFPDRNSGSANWPYFYTKDLIVWNTLGTEINDFQGTVQVADLYPNEDSTLGDWTLSSGSTAWSLVDETTPNDTDYVQSAVPPTAALRLGYTDLDPDVTSVRALTTIMRAFNSDSGDGQVQMAVSPNGGVDEDTGTAHFLTVSPTYFWDTSTISPATGFSWTPTEVNSLTVSFNRTT